MKKCWILLTAVILLGLLSYSALSMSPTYYLRSRLTNLTAELYKEMSDMVEPGADEYFSLALLPLIDVNGEKPELTIYLYQRVSEVISQFPGLRVAGYAETVNIWNELRAQKLSDSERFQALGKKLNVSVLVMTSLVTHSTHYTINGMVINATTGYQHEIDQIILERGLIDAIPKEEITTVAKAAEESLRKGVSKPETANSSGTAKPGGQSETKPSGTTTGTPSNPGTSTNQGSGTKPTQPTSPGTGAGAPTQPTSPGTGSGNPAQPTGSNSSTKPGSTTQPTKPGTAEPPANTQPGDSVNAPIPGEETNVTPESESSTGVKPLEPQRHQLVLKEQSPLLSSIMLGMDMGDLNGDGVDELIYCAGPSIQVRNLNNYYFLWTYDKYQPTTRDYKILAVDLDGDGKDEVASHGSLLKVVNNKLTTQQPRFVARPVALYKHSGVALFDKTSIYVVNFQGLVMKQFVLNAVAKRFVFADLEGDGKDEIIALMDGEADNLKAQIYTTVPQEAKQTLSKPRPIEGTFSGAISVMDLNQNGLPEIYLSRNVFSGTQFLYSKIYVYESSAGQLKLITESPELSYFIVDFAGYPKKMPNRLVVGGMALKSKTQSPAEIKSKILYFALE